MFCKPNITTIDDLDLVKDYGVDFLRIGTTPNNYKKSEKYIKYAIKNKIDFFSFLMQSSSVLPKKFSQISNNLTKMGSKKIYIVDSAGCMFEDSIKEYYYEVKSLNLGIKLGFHGHNNLGLANSNTLFCYKIGFDYLDSTLMGIGRSAGNACTEQLLGYLEINKEKINIDFDKIAKFSNSFFKKKNINRDFSILDIILGINKIHSENKKEVIKIISSKIFR